MQIHTSAQSLLLHWYLGRSKAAMLSHTCLAVLFPSAFAIFSHLLISFCSEGNTVSRYSRLACSSTVHRRLKYSLPSLCRPLTYSLPSLCRPLTYSSPSLTASLDTLLGLGRDRRRGGRKERGGEERGEGVEERGEGGERREGGERGEGGDEGTRERKVKGWEEQVFSNTACW